MIGLLLAATALTRDLPGWVVRIALWTALVLLVPAVLLTLAIASWVALVPLGGPGAGGAVGGGAVGGGAVSGGRGSGLVLLGLSGLLLVVALRSAWSGSSRLADPGDRGRSAGEVARQFVLAAGDFDYREGTGYHSRLLGLTDGPPPRGARGRPHRPRGDRERAADAGPGLLGCGHRARPQPSRSCGSRPGSSGAGGQVVSSAQNISGRSLSAACSGRAVSGS